MLKGNKPVMKTALMKWQPCQAKTARHLWNWRLAAPLLTLLLC